MTLTVRPATPADCEAARLTFPDMQPDRWRAGAGRRSFVAIAHKDIVGHCRGVDNAAHPGSRVYFYETTVDHERAAVADALIAAQVGVLHVPDQYT